MRNSESTKRLKEELQYKRTMLRHLFQRKPKHERLEEEPEVRFKGLLVSEKDLGYTYIRPGGKTLHGGTYTIIPSNTNSREM